MITTEQWQEIHTMRARGSSIREIARDLHLATKTVCKYLQSSHPPQFKARTYGTKVDPYRVLVVHWLTLAWTGPRVYNELVRRGYTGSLATVQRYIQQLRHDATVPEEFPIPNTWFTAGKDLLRFLKPLLQRLSIEDLADLSPENIEQWLKANTASTCGCEQVPGWKSFAAELQSRANRPLKERLYFWQGLRLAFEWYE